jgi:uncharacterized protein
MVWFLLAHGAGASSSSAWMQHWRVRLGSLGPVHAFDYPFMTLGRKRPDTLPVLITAHREALGQGAKRHGPHVVLIGKSMGSRVGCHLALDANVLGVVCLGYPLRGQNPNSPPRSPVLLALTAPACFVQGTRDRLCPLPELRAVLAVRAAPSTLHVVQSGDHSLLATKTHLKANGLTQDAVDDAALTAIRRFVLELPGSGR